MGGIRSFCSVSCTASVFMVLYISMAGFNLYQLMFPLAMIDISTVPESDFVQPLWKKAGNMHMRVYLSTRSKFSMAFIRSEYAGAQSSGEGGENEVQTGSKLPSDVALLWDEDLSSPAFSKSFMLTTLDCDEKETCESDESFRYAASWLDEAEQLAVEQDEGGVLSVMSSAGQGIESTSFLLTAYQSISKQTRSLAASLSLIPPLPKEEVKARPGLLDRTMIKVPKTSPIWSTLGSNATLYVHVLVLRTEPQSGLKWPPTNMDEAMSSVDRASKTNSLLLGKVDMTKFDKPHHLTKPRRILVHDLVYLWKRYFQGTREFPPWEMAYWKPEDYAKHEQLLEMKKNGATYPYWKPEVSIKYVNDESKYPMDYAGLSGMPMVQVKRDSNHPTGIAFIPALHVDEIGLTSEKYIPVNETLTSLPLRISFDRSDMDHQSTSATATAGGISPARWRLLSHLSDAIEQQKKLGFEQSDIDDVRRLIADTNVTLLAITMFASAMHLLFEFLTFKSEVSFWQNNKDLTGLSVRSLFLDTIGQSIILLFLIEKDSSLLMTIPCAIGCLIALWKCQRAAGFQFVKVSSSSTTQNDRPVAWWNRVPRLMVGYELRAMRLEASERADSDDSPLSAKENLYALTLESDQIATKTLGVVVLPLVVGYTLYSFAFEEHSSWFSWLITSASSAVYALGFVLMTPQLFLNYKLKSVAHLPWRVLVYKSLNTFIDDLFSFIIRMPTMARISCFRDDIVFFIYLYQRWMYPVDDSRPVEGGGEGKAPEAEAETEAKTDTKKKKKNQ